MTKKYDIIHLNGFMYAVEKYTFVDIGEVGLAKTKDNSILIGKISRKLGAGLSEINSVPCHRPAKVIATNDPSLGLPLLPEIEEDINNIFEKASKSNLFENDLIYNIGNKPEAYYIAKRIFIEGYKAASAKKYTEEDLRKAFLEGWNHEDGGEKLLTHTWQELLQSLNPLPIAVEIEVSPKPFDDQIVMENNFVKVVKWIYHDLH